MAYVSSSRPRAPPVPYTAPMGTRWARETAAAGGVGAFDLPTDPKLIGPWILGECIGKGASGRVKIAKHKVSGKLAAVKILPLAPLVNSRASLATQQAENEKQRLGIEREITMMKLMNHPNIMRIYDVYEGTHELFLVLEYVEGGELFDFLVNRKRLPNPEALECFKQIVYGLNYAHTFSIIHRDLKPENILIASLSPPLIKIADWGMAAFAPPSLQLETSCGSPHYASPEIVNGERYEGNATDIWSCGVILYALLTGRLPFDDKNVKVLLSKVKAGKYEMPDWIDPFAQDLLARMLVVDVSRRITIPEILSHPWILSVSRSSTDRSRPIPNPPLPPSPSTLARPLRHASLIDEELLSSLRVIWGRHTDPQGDSIKRDLCAPAGKGVHAKAFYFLLGRYRDDSRRARHSDGVPTNQTNTILFNKMESMRFNLAWELDLDGTKYDQRLLSAPNSRVSAAPVPQISGLAPPLMSRTPTAGSSRERPASPAGPRAHARRSQLPQQPPNIFAPQPRGSPRPDTTTPAPLASPQFLRQPPATRTRSHTTSAASPILAPRPRPAAAVPPPAPAEELIIHAPAVPVELPLLTAPRTTNSELQKTMDAVAERLNGLAKAQASSAAALPPLPMRQRRFTTRAVSRPAPEDKENQNVYEEGWSYVGVDEYQSGVGLGVDGVSAKIGKEMGNVVFLPENAADSKAKKDKERKGKHTTLPALKPKRSTISLLASPIILSSATNHHTADANANPATSRITSPVVGEFKGWFSNLFSWKGNHPSPGTGVIYSPDGLEKTRREVGLLFERLGIVVEGSGFSFAEGMGSAEDDFTAGMALRCKVEEASAEGGQMVLKPVKFRVEFSAAPAARVLTLNALLAAPLDPPLKNRASVLMNRTTSGGSAFPPGCQAAIVLVHEKGSASTFKGVWKKLKEAYAVGAGGYVYPTMSPAMGTTPFMEQPQRFAI
ncbi:hypothetical protein B0H16DRAFT_1316504 [Mycena metata]|uniref:Protein kinase domain-containing protein n=1 Tax=Mycena metata TaxID=1033252 RepID=A0AAD7J1T9_9AGAR|nr:hypothetical protein B0H16DRAFT_1316504 [Mycena metata]